LNTIFNSEAKTKYNKGEKASPTLRNIPENILKNAMPSIPHSSIFMYITL
jgi:hypothetical protein